ncbi:MAG: patatin-like phospholipase family protein [Bdellovibrionales bacterium]
MTAAKSVLPFPPPSDHKNKPKVAIAYSAGSSHGAAGYGATLALAEAGILDAIDIVAISGNSAGSWNGAALAHGLAGETPSIAKAVDTQKAIWDAIKLDGSAQGVLRFMFAPLTATDPSAPKLHILEDMTATGAAYTIDLMASFAQNTPLGMFIKSTNAHNRDRIAKIVDFDAINASAVQFYTGALALRQGEPPEETITRNGNHSANTIAASCAYVSPHIIDGTAFKDAGLEKAVPIQVMEETGFDHLFVFGEKPHRGELLHPIHQREKTLRDGAPHAAKQLAHHVAFLARHKPYKITFFDFDLGDDESSRKNFTPSHIDGITAHGYDRVQAHTRAFGKDSVQWPSFDPGAYANALRDDMACRIA